jgi:hypothetical protein
VLATRGIGALGSVQLCSTLLALLAALLLLVPSLLLAFLALLLLLAPTTGETPYEALGLVGDSSDGVLSSLDGLPGLVGDASKRALRKYALSKCLERGASLIHPTAYLRTTPTSCGGPGQQRGYEARDSSPIGP